MTAEDLEVGTGAVEELYQCGALRESLEGIKSILLALLRIKVLWLGSLLPRLLTTPNGSQWLPTTPDGSYDYKHTSLLASNDSHLLLTTSAT